MLIIFDVEGVLLNAEYLPVLAQLLGPAKEKEIWDITKQGIRGDINWEEGLIKRVAALQGINFVGCKKNLVKIWKSCQVLRIYVAKTLKKAGWKMLAVSGGFTIITDRLKEELGLDRIFSNELVFANGKLEGLKLKVTSDKSISVRSVIKEWNVKREDVVVVVDGLNDLKLFDIGRIYSRFLPSRYC